MCFFGGFQTKASVLTKYTIYYHITFLRFARVVGNNFQPKWWFNSNHYGSKSRCYFFGAKRSPSTNCESTTNEATKNTDSHPWPRSIKLLLTSKKPNGVDIVARKEKPQKQWEDNPNMTTEEIQYKILQ